MNKPLTANGLVGDEIFHIIFSNAVSLLIFTRRFVASIEINCLKMVGRSKVLVSYFINMGHLGTCDFVLYFFRIREKELKPELTL